MSSLAGCLQCLHLFAEPWTSSGTTRSRVQGTHCKAPNGIRCTFRSGRTAAGTIAWTAIAAVACFYSGIASQSVAWSCAQQVAGSRRCDSSRELRCVGHTRPTRRSPLRSKRESFVPLRACDANASFAEKLASPLRSQSDRVAAALRSLQQKASDEDSDLKLTADEHQALKQMLTAAEEAADDVEEEMDPDKELSLISAEYRINKTLEFCPDGVLARTIIGEMVRNGTVPRANCWNLIIDAFGSRGALDDALAVFREMQEARVAANGETYDVLARPAMRRGEYRFVERLYVAKASDRGGGIGAQSLAILLDAYANGSPPQTDRAEAAFRGEMDYASERGISTDEVASDEVLRALRRVLGLNSTCDMCWEFGIDPARML